MGCGRGSVLLSVTVLSTYKELNQLCSSLAYYAKRIGFHDFLVDSTIHKIQQNTKQCERSSGSAGFISDDMLLRGDNDAHLLLGFPPGRSVGFELPMRHGSQMTLTALG